MLRTQCNLRTVILMACCLCLSIFLSCRQETQQPAANTAAVPAANTAAVPASTAREPAVMYQGKAAVEAANKMKEKIGGTVKVLDVNIAPSYMSVDVQDPKDPKKLSHYECRNGTITGPTPMSLSEEINLQSSVFNIDEVDLSVVPNLVQAAKDRLKIEGGEVQGMDIRRNIPVSNDIRWHVGVTGVEKAGFVDADGKGNIKEGRVY